MLENFKKEKDAGMMGLNKGIPFSLSRFNNFIPGVRKERIYLIGGGSGAGKSKTANELFIFNTFDNWRLRKEQEGKDPYPLKIHYFSLEMPESQIVAELASRWIHRYHGVLVDAQYLLSHWTEHTLDGYINELLESEGFAQYVRDFEECVTIIDMSLNHIKFSSYVNKLADDYGTISKKNITKKNGDTLSVFAGYEEDDPNQVTIVVVDHISLVKCVSGQSKKQMIDDMADIMIKARNRFLFTFVVTQQLNRGFNSTDRVKLDDVLPKDADFRDGSGLFDAANVVLGLMSPSRERHQKFAGWQVADVTNGGNVTEMGFGNRLLILNIVKNRHGAAFGVFSLLFLGETGELFELPRDPGTFNMDELKKYRKYYL